MYYSAFGMLAALTLIIVNWDILYRFKISYDKPAWNVYRRFLFAILAYYITDILWGILESKKLVTALFVDTTVYFVAMSVGISFWAEYTVAYLGEKSRFGRFLVYIGRFIAGMISALAMINIFTPVLFTVDDECVYKALPARYVMLTSQILMLIIISVYALSTMIRLGSSAGRHTRYKILAAFGLIMAVTLFVQLWFPYLPIYSIAYMLGTCLLHSFVANDEKEEHRRTEKEAKKVRELNDTFASILDHMPGMTFTKDAKTGVYLACNQAFAEYANKEKPEDVVGLNNTQIFDAETAAHFAADDKTALSLSKPYIFFEDVPDAAGDQKQLQTTKLKYTDTSGRLCILGICQDVTDMVRVQHEHAMTKDAYEKAVSSGLIYTQIAQTLAKDYIDLYYVNTDSEEYVEYRIDGENGTLSEVNRGWHFFSDCKMELADNVFADDRETFLKTMNRKTLMKTLDRKDIFAMTFRRVDTSGQIYVNMKISRMEDEKYIIIGITNVDAEMRETMAKNKALADALSIAENANKEKAKFLSGMSHDLRSPMNAIIGLDTIALKNDKLDSNTRDYLEKIGESANSLLRMINEILTVNQKNGDSSEHSGGVSHSSVHEHGGRFNKDNMYVLVVDDDPIEAEYTKSVLDEAGIKADSCTSGQAALHNLEVQHAKQDPYNIVLMDWNMPGMNGSEASVEVLKHYRNECAVVALTAYNWEDIEKEARSVGVESYLQKPLFSANIIKKLERIAHESDVAAFNERKRADLSGRLILLAEDVELNAEIMADSLELEDIKVDHAENGLFALQKFENSSAGEYAAILMDIRMPIMDGLEAAKAIRALDREDAKKIPIIALTGNAFDEEINRSAEAGMNAHLVKPVDTEYLLQIMGELVYEAENQEDI
ncbi:CheY chemotaxis protein or a CheY-like REC (receiver) domain [Eubacterium ruminantium]|nr:CheY chemotaxis protein or a CheY-like REC (receiver) domain [Eubacterium ruminantium]